MVVLKFIVRQQNGFYIWAKVRNSQKIQEQNEKCSISITCWKANEKNVFHTKNLLPFS